MCTNIDPVIVDTNRHYAEMARESSAATCIAAFTADARSELVNDLSEVHDMVGWLEGRDEEIFYGAIQLILRGEFIRGGERVRQAMDRELTKRSRRMGESRYNQIELDD